MTCLRRALENATKTEHGECKTRNKLRWSPLRHVRDSEKPAPIQKADPRPGSSTRHTQKKRKRKTALSHREATSLPPFRHQSVSEKHFQKQTNASSLLLRENECLQPTAAGLSCAMGRMPMADACNLLPARREKERTERKWLSKRVYCFANFMVFGA